MNESVEQAVRDELGAFGEPLSVSALAASALAAARQLDRRFSWATAKELRETLAELRALAPPKQEEDEVDRKRRQRAERLAGQSAAGTSSPS